MSSSNHLLLSTCSPVHRHVGVVERPIEEHEGCQDEVEDGGEEAKGGPAQPLAAGLQGAAQLSPDRSHAGGGQWPPS